MEIGVLVERKRDEKRVALRTDQVRTLLEAGHRIWVERGAGEAVGYSDLAYEEQGAICAAQDEVWQRSALVLKVKCPLPEEYRFLRSDHVVFTYLHFDENIEAARIQQIVDTGVTGIAYEWVEEQGQFPLLQPMSELTGAVCARHTMSLLMEHKATLGGGYLEQWPASHAMVIGAGHIGSNAINVFARNKFLVTVVDKHPETLEERLGRYMSKSVWQGAIAEVIRFDESRPEVSVKAIRAKLPNMDIVICAAVRRPSLPKAVCEFLIRREDVAKMAKNTVICDATACNQEFIETCVSSDSLMYNYSEEGVIHYNCDHVPSLVAKTATTLLTDATLPYVRLLANGFERAVRQDSALAKGVMCYRGQLTHALSARKKNLHYTDLNNML